MDLFITDRLGAVHHPLYSGLCRHARGKLRVPVTELQVMVYQLNHCTAACFQNRVQFDRMISTGRAA